MTKKVLKNLIFNVRINNKKYNDPRRKASIRRNN